MSSLHFSIGEGFHSIILGIAREHLCKCDTKKSIAMFTEGCGMDTDMAIQVIKGELGLDTDIENQSVVVNENGDNWFEKEFKKIIKFQIKDKVEHFTYCHLDLLQILKDFVYDDVGKYDNNPTISVKIDVDIKTYITNGNVKVESPVSAVIERAKNIIQKINDYHNLSVFGLNSDDLELLYYQTARKEFSDKVLKHIQLWSIQDFRDCEFHLCLAINNITNYNYRKAKDFISSGDCSILPGMGSVENYIENYINALKELDERELSVPVHKYKEKINHFYNAYWIDREGNAYGAEGPVSAMLHINMADAICDKFYPDCKEDKSSHLERLGYVKISDNWVLYLSDYIDLSDSLQIERKFAEPITEKQKETICNIFSQGKRIDTFYAGYSRQLISLSKFKQMDGFMLNNLFKL